MATNTPRTIAFLSDLHAGSWWGLWPNSKLPATGFVGVRYLLDCWADLFKSWPRQIDVLILAGDLIEGPQRKSGGIGCFAVSDREQVEGAIELLRPICRRAKRVLRLTGTPYHDGHGDPLLALDYALGVDWSGQILDLDLNGEILNAAHHPMGGGTLYQGTSTDREALWSTISSGTDRTLPSRWIVRAHRHHYIRQETEHKTVVQLPCWQLQTPFAAKANYWRFQPSLGGVLMLADTLEPGGYRFVPRLYQLPRQAPVTMQELERSG